MKKIRSNRLLAAVLTLVLLLQLLPVTSLAVTEKTYVLDASEDLEPVAAGAMGDGTLSCGTDDFFIILFGGSKMKIDSSKNTFPDEYKSTQRINFQGETLIDYQGGIVKQAIQFKTKGPATIQLWWISGGDGRSVAVYDGDYNIVQQTNAADSVKNSKYITEFSVDAAGVYYLGNPDGNNNFYKIQVTEQIPDDAPVVTRTPWEEVAAPVISSAADQSNGTLQVTVDALVGTNGGDKLVVELYNGSTLIDQRESIAERSQHTVSFQPETSGTYTLRATLYREEQTPKAGADVSAAFSLPLQTPAIILGTSKGGGVVQLQWTAVKEAEKYEILVGGTVMATVTDTTGSVSGLTVGTKYDFQVRAVRGSESTTSQTYQVTATKDEMSSWGFTVYGDSTNEANNGYVGNLNEDGSVTVYSEGGKGKIQPTSVDGLAFYYTAIPTEYNFTLRAKVTVDAWTLSNGQEGFGLMAADRLGVNGDKTSFWNNSVMALASKIEYRWDGDNEVANDVNGTGSKYSMKLGLGTLVRTGITKANLSLFESNDTNTIQKNFVSQSHPLEWAAGYWSKDNSGTYNVIGNRQDTGTGATDVEMGMITEMILEIQKNNTGYFITYYSASGEVLCQRKYYGADMLNQLDSQYVYAGFFAARNARVTFSDVSLTKVLAKNDAPAEEQPKTEITPSMSIYSSTVTTNQDYSLALDSNVAGTVTITLDNVVVAQNETVQAQIRYYKKLDLDQYGDHRLQIAFTPDPNQDLGPNTILTNSDKIFLETTLRYNMGFFHRTTLYVSPDGLPNGAGTREYPFDIYTAVENATPGQTIVLMEGIYKLDKTVKIQRGMDGTEFDPIRMIADPEAATRPVLDFQGKCAGIVHGGDWWYFQGFDVTRSQDGQKGFQVSGNYNILDQIKTYRNGNTGIQISRYSGSDTAIEDWPSYNLVLNCTSFLNSDPGEEDADGFACKLTSGVGNVFDGCVAYNNADDGWDLYAKVETGCIGSVTIRNCAAYSNGVREDGTIGNGNGNGFKMGGMSLSGYHVLENSYAFDNKSKGIDSNSCPDIIVRNCVSYNNGSHNVAFYTNNAGHTDFSANGILSFKDSSSRYTDSLTVADKLSPKGNQDTSKYENATNYYWNGSVSQNIKGAAVNKDIFVSLKFQGVKRNSDGTIDMQGFLEVNSKAPSGSGVVEDGTPSEDVQLPTTDMSCDLEEEWTNTDAEYHWHACKDCGFRADIGLHELQWVIDREATPDKSGIKHQECTVCKYQMPALEYYYEEETTEPTEPEDPTAGQTDPTDPSGSQTPDASTGSEEDPTSPDAPQGLSPALTVIVVVLVLLLLLGVAAIVALKLGLVQKWFPKWFPEEEDEDAEEE